MPRKHTFSFTSQDEYRLVALVSSLKDYRITFYLNQVLGMDFVRYNDLAYTRSGNIMGTYQWFYYYCQQDHTTYYLIGNKHKGGSVISSAKDADYIVFIKNPVDPDTVKKCIVDIRTITNVLTAFEVPLDTVKDLAVILDTIELHELEQIPKD